MQNQILALSLFASLLQPASTGVCGGGDPFDIYLMRGRFYLKKILSTIDLSRTNDYLTDPNTVDWLFRIKQDLITDIESSRWSESPTPLEVNGERKCAVTLFERNAVVRFDREFCRSQGLVDVQIASEMILHESLHHFQGNVTDLDFAERQAKTVAHVIMKIALQDPTLNRIVEISAGSLPTSHSIYGFNNASVPMTWIFQSEKETHDVYAWFEQPGALSSEEFQDTGFRRLSLDGPAVEWQPVLADTKRYPIAPNSFPSAPIKFSSLVWSGFKNEKTDNWLMTWGGCTPSYDCQSMTNQGLLHHTETRETLPTPLTHAPEGRVFHTGALLGNEALVWGGVSHKRTFSPSGLYEIRSHNDGALFNFETKTWKPLVPTATTPSPRFGHSTVSTGDSIIIWGGCESHQQGQIPFNKEACKRFFCDGARIDAKTLQWKPIKQPEFKLGCHLTQAVWTGSKMIVWGGYGYQPGPSGRLFHPAVGGIYDPQKDDWVAFASRPEFNRIGSQLFWTGQELAVIGGREMFNPTTHQSIMLYSPERNRWRTVSTSEIDHFVSISAVWTGLEFLLLPIYENRLSGISTVNYFKTFIVNPNAQIF